MKWQITIAVEARGRQVWQVEASNESDAIAKARLGDGSCIHEDFEVTDSDDTPLSVDHD